MPEELVLLQKLLASALVGYLLGAVPFAHLAARLNGVDIFATGSRRAGTANVFWNVGRRIGVMVFVGDVAKGAVAVLIARLLDIPGFLVLLAAAAAVVGHWKSIFTSFRGGDGMATLLGVSVTIVPTLALIGIATGLVAVLLRWRSSMRSAWGIVICFSVMLAASQIYQTDRQLVLGLATLAAMVVGHNYVSRHGAGAPDDAPGLSGLDDDGDADLGPTAHEKR